MPDIPDQLQLYVREQLARIDRLHAAADRKRQELELSPGLYQLEIWKVALTALGAGAALFAAGAAFFRLLH